ncbi:hypothetical protein EHQ68_05350 [Leptospira congkakensis]|uniref:Uncharacterized protein n=1 Tax=Leptospira congkakensis TaxID=2484932 RepID=A0A4Z1AEJ5_9LEPT|nr:hypothetical protein [Leptospira congkakensis]TGL90844.1 hypothetical protein EHQ69_13110 [Leptospira congkakensis]TGL91853.1 hypothetical protein EHQ68_05350 [Leptospira congkakensis]TGL98905.1 hypothetical protein EHQ70_04945 [Leptospira congkakensis]
MKQMLDKFSLGVLSLFVVVNCSTAKIKDAKPDTTGPSLNIYVLETDTTNYSGRKKIVDSNFEFAEVDIAFQNISKEPYPIDFLYMYNEAKGNSPESASIVGLYFCCHFGEGLLQELRSMAFLTSLYNTTLSPGQIETRRYHYLVKKGEFPKELTFYKKLTKEKDPKEGLEKITVIPIKK